MIRVFSSKTSDSKKAYALLAFGFRLIYGGNMPPLEKTSMGKPYFPSRPDVHFSISHTKTHVMAAIGPAPCGCDIETLRPVNPKVAQRVCSERELLQFDFFSLWVLKESYIKFTGDNTLNLKKTEFSIDNGTIVTPDPMAKAKIYQGDAFRAAVISRESLSDNITFVPFEVLTAARAAPNI